MIFANKNWLANPHIGCVKPLDFTNGFEVKFILVEELDVEFEDEVMHKKILEIVKSFV
jgi:hypothetical protein